jgi:hypothetical protein
MSGSEAVAKRDDNIDFCQIFLFHHRLYLLPVPVATESFEVPCSLIFLALLQLLSALSIIVND